MQSYEYKDEGGRFLCKLHHQLRCDECHYVSELRDENRLYRKAFSKAIERLHSTPHFDEDIAMAIETLEGVWEKVK